MNKHQEMSTQVVLFKEITGGCNIPIIKENKAKHGIQEEFNEKGKRIIKMMTKQDHKRPRL